MNDRPPRFREVSPKVDFPALDARILEFWRSERIFEKSIELRRDAPLYSFYEGPPTANGRPGSHHVLSRVFKDIFPRFKTMRGFRVPRKAGWDCHGLPVELEVERRLGIDGKEQIEEYGVARFNALCRESVLTYLKDWDRMTERIGFWIDLDDAYYTLTNDYIESVWWLLRQIWDRELLYEGFKVVPYCPRCGTAISSHEMAQGYHDVTEPSVYVRFPLTAAAAAKVATLGAAAGDDAVAVAGDGAVRRRRRGGRAGRPRRPRDREPGRLDDHALDPRLQRRLRRQSRDRLRPRREPRRALRAGPRPGRGGARRQGRGRARHPRQLAAGPRVRSALPVRGARPARLVCGRRRLRHGWRRHRHRAHRAGLRRRRHAHRGRQRPAGRQPRRRRRTLRRRGRALGSGVRQRRRRRHHRRPLGPWPAAGRGALRAQLPVLLALRHAAALLLQDDLVCEDDGDQGRSAGRQRGCDLVPRAHQARPLWRVAREQRRLGAVARPLLGHAAAHLALRRRPRALRGQRRRTAHAGRHAAPRRPRAASPVRRRRRAALSRVRRRHAARARSDRRLVRFGLDAVRPVALPVRQRSVVSASAFRPTSSPRRSTRPGAGSTACSRWPRWSRAAAPTRRCSASATSWTPRARR